jgi:hypothetical protein
VRRAVQIGLIAAGACAAVGFTTAGISLAATSTPTPAARAAALSSQAPTQQPTEPAAQAPQSQPLSAQQQIVVFPRNAKGLSYGSELDAASPDTAPGLIEAIATNGQLGYVLKTDLHPALPKSPQEALAQQAAAPPVRTIPVYDLAGHKIGVFEIQKSTQ